MHSESPDRTDDSSAMSPVSCVSGGEDGDVLFTCERSRAIVPISEDSAFTFDVVHAVVTDCVNNSECSEYIVSCFAKTDFPPLSVSWDVCRRYSQFKQLHDALGREDIELPASPPKRVFKNRPKVLEERIAGLTRVLNAVVSGAGLRHPKTAEFLDFPQAEKQMLRSQALAMGEQTSELQQALQVKEEEIRAAQEQQQRSAEKAHRAEVQSREAYMLVEKEKQAREVAEQEISARDKAVALAVASRQEEQAKGARGREQVEAAAAALEQTLRGQEAIKAAVGERDARLSSGEEMELVIACSASYAHATGDAVAQIEQGMAQLQLRAAEAEGMDLDESCVLEIQDMVRMAQDYLQFAQWQDLEANEKAEGALAVKQACVVWRARADEQLETARRAVLTAQAAARAAEEAAEQGAEMTEAAFKGLAEEELERLVSMDTSPTSQVQQYVSDAAEATAQCARSNLSLHETCSLAPLGMRDVVPDLEAAAELLAAQAAEASVAADHAAEHVAQRVAHTSALASQELAGRAEELARRHEAARAEVGELAEAANNDAIEASEVSSAALERVNGVEGMRELSEAREQVESVSTHVEGMREKAAARAHTLEQILERMSVNESEGALKPSILEAEHAIKDCSTSLDSALHLLQQATLQCDLEPVSYTHLRAHETVLDLVCRLLLEKKKKKKNTHE
eukprot:TRINITY_DN8262_c0_g1_i3.p1 TRINITY_DN8262_c0_g1~~TRINITY_DN8262_c0_g1_i3.p1  ORF type:complete len:685 (-),score=214.41 TRINITY_DN8262_c0_g1_i3:3-2057(-)